MMEQTTTGLTIPVRAGSTAVMSELLASLNGLGFTPEAVSARLGIESIYDYQTLDIETAAPASIESGLDALIHLFLAGRALQIERVLGHLGDALVAHLESLGLLLRDEAHPDHIVPTVLFYPVEGCFVASDLGSGPFAEIKSAEDSEFIQPADSVYPAIAKNTGELLSLMPRYRCGTFLDLCSGTAVGALAMAPFSDHAWAVDLTERSTRFAEFNVALNGVQNVTVLQGDLFEPVSDRKFDYVLAHPPYVPTLGPGLIYRSGGSDGEHITRRIIEQLPKYLAPGGQFFASCMLSDREEATVEERLREMLGESSDEFDVFVVSRAGATPAEYFSRRLSGKAQPMAEEELVAGLREAGVVRLVLCTLAIRRHESQRPPVTARRQSGERSGRAELEWLMEWETAAADPGLPARLAGATVRVSPAVRLELFSRPGELTWVPEQCRLRTEWPFERVIEVPLEIAQFVIGCDGNKTVAEHLERAQSSGLAPADLTAAEFAARLMPLIGSGVLAVDGPA